VADPQYALSQQQSEYERLARQAAAVDPFTERLFRAAGIGPGMRVLDIGSGAGHVAYLAQRLVGPSGEVVGIDREAEVLAVARAHGEAAGIGNVTFRHTELRDLTLPDGSFDAVVGRYVLMYQADPTALLTRLAPCLRDGGVMAFHEVDIPTEDRPLAGAWPPSDLERRLGNLVLAVWRATGTQLRMGPRLPAAFATAGLEPSPDLHTAAICGVGRPWAESFVGMLRSMLPAIVEHGLADPDELDLDTAVDRLLRGVPEPGPVGMGPVMVGAWARRRDD
jgi:SAM-dependent methyltransferase